MIMVHIRNFQRKYIVPEEDIQRLGIDTLSRLACHEGELTFVYVSALKMKNLNGIFRGIPHPTDVLSFPESEPNGYLGDIIIAPSVAWSNIRKEPMTLNEEMALLHIHGILHLLGYDHENDHGDMMARQNELFHVLPRPLPDFSCAVPRKSS